MGIFNKTKKTEPLTQVEWTMKELMAGRKLTQIDMLMDYGIGHHCEIIRRCRVLLQKEGKPYDYIRTDWVTMRSKRTGRRIRFASYSIPEIREKR